MGPLFNNGRSADHFAGRLDRLQTRALMAGGTGLAVCIAAGFFWPHELLSSYLVAYLFWVGIGLGCLGLTMLHHLVGGQWGLPIRRPMEAGAMTLIPLALLFVPLVINLGILYPWARYQELQLDPELRHKSAYLNPDFFLFRTGCYFAIWISLALMLCRWSRAQDTSEDSRPSSRLQQLSGPGLVILFLTSTFAAIDWAMSLEPRWASTIYGAMMITGEALATLAVMIIIASAMATDPHMGNIARPGILHDLGNLLLAFVMLWAYMAFSQFLIIWAGNLREEIPWYIRRTHGGWEWIALSLIAVHFFLPFFVLLFREIKLRTPSLLLVASLILVMHLVDLTWLVIPSSADTAGPRIPWGDIPLILITTVGIGGISIAVFLWHLKAAPLVPLHDAHLEAILQHEGST
jgi:hypothetical protein